MLTATNLYIQYGDRVLLDHIDFVIKPGERIGLVGKNGAGKSTILKILAGELNPDEGSVSLPSGSTMGFLHQEIEVNQNKNVLDEALEAFQAVRRLDKELVRTRKEIETRTDYESEAYMNLVQRFSEMTEQYALLGGESVEGEAVKVLGGLGFKQSDLERKIGEFSGGWQMRVVLAKMLLKKPDFLLLDEPTNHLDIESIIWLEGFLGNYQGAAVIISHDQQFLDNCTNRTVEIELGRLEDYKAPYTQYTELRKERKEKQIAAYNNQQRVIAQKEKTIKRFMAKASKTNMAQSMQKQLDKIDRIEIAMEDHSRMNLRFPPAPRSGEVVLQTQKLVKSFGEIHVLNNIDFRVLRGQRVAFVGQNGQGKTTLAKILVGALKPTLGNVNKGHNVHLGYYAQNQAEILDTELTLLQTMENHSPPEMRTKLRDVLGAFLFSGEDVDKKVSVLSGGERARLAMACMLLRPINLLVMDEPTNHLDMLSKEILKKALIQYDGTMIVVSHDRQFLAGLTDITYEFRDQKIYEYLGDVNYFLEKRQVDNLREVEKKAHSSENNSLRSENPTDAKQVKTADRKRTERQIENLEKKIIRAEELIKEIEVRMSQPGFYESSESRDILKKYEEEKDKLESLQHKWDNLFATLEKM